MKCRFRRRDIPGKTPREAPGLDLRPMAMRDDIEVRVPRNRIPAEVRQLVMLLINNLCMKFSQWKMSNEIGYNSDQLLL